MSALKMKLKFLGTGTSQGVPVIGCDCQVCHSKDPKDKRLRCSVLLSNPKEQKILIDCGPDFRMQMLDNKESSVDAILLTHEHNDHVIGLDDVRPLIFRSRKDMDLYCLPRVANEIEKRFPYAFAPERYPGAPAFEIHEIGLNSFSLFETSIQPIEVLHGKLPILGYRVKDLAYITDASSISHSEKEKLKNLDILILNCIRKESPHPAHFILPDIFELVEELQPKRTLLTHLSHHFGMHEKENEVLPKGVELAFDGMEIEF